MAPPDSEPRGSIHHVFVDFENVPVINLETIGGRPVEVVLLLGKSQKRLELSLVQQIHQHASQVRLIEMNASGKNALDFALSFHLGRAVAGLPATDLFHIVSRDKGFDPLIAHLRQGGIRIVRHDSFALAAVLAVGAPVAPPPGRPVARPAPPPERATVADKVTALALRLRKSAANRPKRKATLLSLIRAQLPGQLREGEDAEILDGLAHRGIITVDTRNKVSYPGF